MTRHNLPSHISWLLSHSVTPPVGVRAPNFTNPISAAQDIPDDISEDELEEEISRRRPSPEPSLATAKHYSDSQKFLRPTLPSTTIQEVSNQELAGNGRFDSMGKLSSASKSARPALLSQQQQLATPASTTGPSSLTARYAVFIETSNGMIIYCDVQNLN